MSLARALQAVALLALILTAAVWPPWVEETAGTGVEVVEIAAGGTHTCGLTSDGGVKCWGNNREGQLGDGTDTNRLTPVDVVGLESGVIDITAGRFHSCAVTADGGAKCWGTSNRGQVGTGDLGMYQTPVDVVRLTSSVAAIEAGFDHTCALTTGGGVKCWGWNASGQLGDGTNENRLAPVDVEGLSDGIAVISAGHLHTCAASVPAFPVVFCWGFQGSGRLGNGQTTGKATTPDLVCANTACSAFLGAVTDISAGLLHTCVVMDTSAVKCWGGNGSGQLGDGTTTDRDTPINVPGLDSGYTAVAAGGTEGANRGHTCALSDGGDIKCWGTNLYGQVGDGTATERTSPVDVSALDSAIRGISAGRSHTCAATLEGTARCWGINSAGQLGNGETENVNPLPVAVIGFGPGKLGDVDCDGEVTSLDAALLLQFVAGLVASLPCEGAADVNGDGSITAVDATLILQFVAGLIEDLPGSF